MGCHEGEGHSHVALEGSEGCDKYIETQVKLLATNQQGVVNVAGDDIRILGRWGCESV